MEFRLTHLIAKTARAARKREYVLSAEQLAELRNLQITLLPMFHQRRLRNCIICRNPMSRVVVPRERG